MFNKRTSKLSSAVIGLTCVSMCCPAIAATLTNANGNVLVNQGDGFKPGSTAQDLPVGTRVMANEQSSAKITYPDGCSVNVLPGRVYVVTAQPPCGLANAGDPGTTLPVGPTGAEYALGAVAVGGIGAAVLIASRKAASP